MATMPTRYTKQIGADAFGCLDPRMLATFEPTESTRVGDVVMARLGRGQRILGKVTSLADGKVSIIRDGTSVSLDPAQISRFDRLISVSASQY